MIIVDIVLGGYVLGAIFVGLQMRRAPCVEMEEAGNSGAATKERDAIVGCDCRRCAVRRSRRVSRASMDRFRLRTARYAAKHREPAVRFAKSSR